MESEGCQMTREEKLEWLRQIPSETISPIQLSIVAGGSVLDFSRGGNLEPVRFAGGGGEHASHAPAGADDAECRRHG